MGDNLGSGRLGGAQISEGVEATSGQKESREKTAKLQKKKQLGVCRNEQTRKRKQEGGSTETGGDFSMEDIIANGGGQSLS